MTAVVIENLTKYYGNFKGFFFNIYAANQNFATAWSDEPENYVERC